MDPYKPDPNIGLAILALVLVTPFYVLFRPRESREGWRTGRRSY
jgi:hypothetical protein